MSNVLRGLILQENPAEKSRMERINKLMGKVYAAKITSQEMPFVHGMYHNHHRKFCRKMDQKFQEEVRKRMPDINVSQVSSIPHENSNVNSSMSLLGRLNDSNDQPVRFGEGKIVESEIRVEMKKKAGGEVLVASENNVNSEIRRMEVSKEESQEKRKQFEAKRMEMQRLKEEEELRKENERIRQLQEERQRQQEKERRRKEDAQRRERQKERERYILKQKEQRQRRQRELQQRQKKAQQQRLVLQAEQQRKKAIAIKKLKQQQRRQEQREQRRRQEQERLASLKLQQQRPAVQSDEQYVEVVEDDSESYYNIRQQEIDVPVEAQKVTRSDINQPAVNNIKFLSHLTTPQKDNFQNPQISVQEKPESFVKQEVKYPEVNQPSNIIEQSASLTETNIDAPSNNQEKEESPSALKVQSKVEESPPSQSLSLLNKNILSGSQSIQIAREQSNNQSAGVFLPSQIIEQTQKEENTIIKEEENVEIRVDKIANAFLQLLQRQSGRCEHHEALLKQSALTIADLTKQNQQLLRQQQQLAERSKKSAIAAELRIIDLQKQLKGLREKLQQEQFYMVKPASKVIKRNNSAGKLSDQSKEPRLKAYNSGEQSLKEESKSQHSYQSDKNSSDEQP